MKSSSADHRPHISTYLLAFIATNSGHGIPVRSISACRDAGTSGRRPAMNISLLYPNVAGTRYTCTWCYMLYQADRPRHTVSLAEQTRPAQSFAVFIALTGGFSVLHLPGTQLFDIHPFCARRRYQRRPAAIFDMFLNDMTSYYSVSITPVLCSTRCCSRLQGAHLDEQKHTQRRHMQGVG